jgi:DNA-binding beta-propeller fold protein YncE
VVRPTFALILAAALALAACGDPLIVLGDAPGRMRIVLGVGDSIGTQVDSVATRTRLTEPTAVAFDAASSVLYAADRGAVIQSDGITRRVARVFSVRSDGRSTLAFSSAACTAVCPEAIQSMAVSADGTLYLTDWVGHRVFRWNRGSTSPVVIAGDGQAGDAPDGVPAQQASLRSPAGIVAASDGRLYFSEQLGHRIRFIDSSGQLQSVAGIGAPGFSGDGGQATSAALNQPTGLVLHGDLLYIADRLNHRIRAISLTTGIIETVAGQGVQGFAGDNGDAFLARFDRPASAAVSDDGVTLFIADYGNHRVRAVNLRTRTVQTVSGTGSSAWNGAGRPAGETSLEMPSGVAARSGFLFIADTGHSVVWRTVIRL